MATPTNTVVKTSDIGPIRRVATVHERESLQRTANVFGYGKDAGDFVSGAVAPVALPGLQAKRQRLNEQQDRIVKILRDQAPEPTNGDEREKLHRHAQALKEKFEQYLQTSAELRAHSHRDPTFISALSKARAWTTPQKELGGRTPNDVAEDWRNIQRRLDPENPEADSFEPIRKAR